MSADWSRATVRVSFREKPLAWSRYIARWPLCCTQLRHRSSATSTTRWDATEEEDPTSAPVDQSGVIRAWLGEGRPHGSVDAEIQCVLRPLL
jgi:hypothetical protein